MSYNSQGNHRSGGASHLASICEHLSFQAISSRHGRASEYQASTCSTNAPGADLSLAAFQMDPSKIRSTALSTSKSELAATVTVALVNTSRYAQIWELGSFEWHLEGQVATPDSFRPQFSQTLVIQNMYQNPAHIPGTTSNPHLRPQGSAPLDANPASGLSEKELDEYFNQFYEDVYCELVKHGNLLEMHVCDNVGDHLIGNVYARYDWEDEAQKAVEAMNLRWYAGRPLIAELSPVTDFREACCRQNDMGECNRGGFCNFMHVKMPDKSMLRSLQQQQRKERQINPDPRDEERRKEMEMFGGSIGGAPSGGDGGYSGGGGGGGGYGGGRSGGRDREMSPRRY
ncbi:splicing factor U2AF 35 kDa subunit, partial [Phenoliferia sp. Uapishka_3]